MAFMWGRAIAASAFLFTGCGIAHADITGTIDATITLTTACQINGQVTNNAVTGVDFGTLDFGSQSTLFTTADAQVTNGAAGIAIQCSNGVPAEIFFQAGQNDTLGNGAGDRAMAHVSVTGQYVSYSLYSNAGRTTVIPVGGSIALASDGTLQTVNVYGRAFGEAGLVPGVYNDVVTVVLQL